MSYLTGNHDPDISSCHTLELAASRVLITHGDILFDNIVPWGRDATLIGQRIDAERRALSPSELGNLAQRFALWRRVAASIAQRHQSEQHGFKYA